MNETTYGMSSLIKVAPAGAEAFLASLDEDGHRSSSGGQQETARASFIDEPIE